MNNNTFPPMKKPMENFKQGSRSALCHPELVEGSVRMPSAFAEAELILRQAQDDRLLRERFTKRPRILLVALFGLFLPINPSLRAQTGPTDSVEPMAKVTLHLGKASLTTQIAASSAQEERGLMYVTKLPDNDGMIFILPKVTNATFWMKNTLIPLSVAFIDKNGVILEIHDMKALDETITRSDSDQVAYALETNLHWFALNGVKPGDKIDPAPATLGPPLP
jgi:uncharacterized membrane protein (UPF0127 family)